MTWKIVKLGQLISESKVESKNPDTNRRIRVKLNLGGIEQRPDFSDKEGATRYYIRKAGQFIYGRQNLHKGAFGIVPDILDGYESSGDIPALDVVESCYPEWIYYFFRQDNLYAKLEPLAKGVGSKRINPSQLYNLNIPLPSKEEQKEILQVIKGIEDKFNEANKEFDTQYALIEKFRQSCLVDAFHGKLTAKWRLELTKLKRKEPVQKRESVIQKKTDLLKGSRANRDDILIMHDQLPANWSLATYDHLILDIEAGKSPFCEPQKAQVNQWGVIKISAVSWGIFREDENKTLPINIAPFIDKEIKPGDFIMSRANTAELIGRSVIVPDSVRTQLLLNDKTLRIKFSNIVNIHYINFYNNGPIARSYYLKVASGTSDSMKNISRDNIKSQPIPLPPISEQNEVVKQIEQLFIKCAQLEQEINTNRKHLMNLFQNQLKYYYKDAINEIQKISDFNAAKPSTLLPFLLMHSQTMKNEIKDIEIVSLLEAHGKMSAISLWQMSKYENDIDAFYAEIKELVEIKKIVRESDDKGFLELIK